MIPRREFEVYLELVRRSEVHTTIEEELRKGTGGAPRQLDVDVFLAAGILTATHHRTAKLTRVRKLMTRELSLSAQRAYGIRSQEHHLVTMRQIYYLVDRIANMYEFSHKRVPDLTVNERTRREEAFTSLIDRLISSPSMYLDPADRYAVDATSIESAARGKFSNKKLDQMDQPTRDRLKCPVRGVCADMDARHGYQTETYDNKSNMYFGYHMMAFTRVGAAGEKDVPVLIEHMRMVPANSDGLQETVDVIEARHLTTNPIAEILSDRAFSFSVVENWAKVLSDLNVMQVMDMHDKDRGARPHPTDGYVMIDGWPHVASIPDHLVRIARPTNLSVGPARKNATKRKKARRDALLAEIAKFRELIAERATYRFERHGKTTGGNYRYHSPARAGKLRCAGYAESLHLPADTPECVHPAGQPIPKACRQRTITVSENVGLKLRQELYWGSDEWIESYARRSRVESSFGLLKASDGGGIKRGWTLHTGLIRTTLLLALQVTASNLRVLLSWAKRNGWTADPLTQVDLTDHGFIEAGADGLPLTEATTGPPEVGQTAA